MSDEHIKVLRELRAHDPRPDSYNHKMNAALDAAIAALGGGWLPIESAPRDGTNVLIYGDEDGAPFTDIGWVEGTDMDEWARYGSDFIVRPTHWMPLPPPPESV